jgi:hypothetical protein
MHLPVVWPIMETVPPIDASDEGKQLYGVDGTRVGIISRGDGDTVHVDPGPDLTERIAARIGWSFVLQGSDETHAVAASEIESVGDDRVVVRRA